MKKQILIVALAVMMMVYLVGCGTTYQEVTGQAESNSSGDFGNGYFTVITKWSDGNGRYRIVYAKDTNVKYFIQNSTYSWAITPLYNADGTLQIYEEGED